MIRVCGPAKSILKAVRRHENEHVDFLQKAYLKAALSIATVEARHAGAIGLIHKMDSKGISPNGPFDKPYSADHVLKDVGKTHFIKG